MKKPNQKPPKLMTYEEWLKLATGNQRQRKVVQGELRKAGLSASGFEISAGEELRALAAFLNQEVERLTQLRKSDDSVIRVIETENRELRGKFDEFRRQITALNLSLNQMADSNRNTIFAAVLLMREVMEARNKKHGAILPPTLDRVDVEGLLRYLDLGMTGLGVESLSILADGILAKLEAGSVSKQSIALALERVCVEDVTNAQDQAFQDQLRWYSAGTEVVDVYRKEKE